MSSNLLFDSDEKLQTKLSTWQVTYMSEAIQVEEDK